MNTCIFTQTKYFVVYYKDCTQLASEMYTAIISIRLLFLSLFHFQLDRLPGLGEILAWLVILLVFIEEKLDAETTNIVHYTITLLNLSSQTFFYMPLDTEDFCACVYWFFARLAIIPSVDYMYARL